MFKDMNSPTEHNHKFSKLLSFLVVILFVSLFSPFKNFKWGKIEQLDPQTITVTGSADSREVSQIATFTASVSVEDENKESAVSEVNEKMTQIVNDLKEFGVEEKNIKTESVNVYEYEESERGKTTGKVLWSASSSVSIRLENVEMAGDLSDLLSASGATSVRGPNFSLDDTDDIDILLLEKAFENAKNKAERLVKVSGRSLGDVFNLVEGSSSQPEIYRSLALPDAKGGAPIEPGTQNVSKTVTVTFEIR